MGYGQRHMPRRASAGLRGALCAGEAAVVRASVVMFLAVLLYIIHRWATNQPAVTLPIVLSGLFVIFVIAMLDQGRTEPVAKGFAWLFFIVAAYNAVPALTGAAKSAKGAATAAAAKPPPKTTLT